MKRNKLFVLAVVIALLISMNSQVLAETAEVLFSSVTVKVNGTQIAAKKEDYTLKNGITIPASITYKNTTYLPLEKIAEIFNMNLSGGSKSKTLSSKKTEAVSCSISDYAGDKFSLVLDTIYNNVKIAYIENDKGVVSTARVNINGGMASVTEASDIVKGKDYKLNVLLNTGETKI